ncbi:hypothetical protein M422DRAFT_247451 [Sphaerobolus stellatus SS14]|nr:hypothetical protein M422DRAFT_247451 [Sphaerobolus stellatus SS14]
MPIARLDRWGPLQTPNTQSHPLPNPKIISGSSRRNLGGFQRGLENELALYCSFLSCWSGGAEIIVRTDAPQWLEALSLSSPSYIFIPIRKPWTSNAFQMQNVHPSMSITIPSIHVKGAFFANRQSLVPAFFRASLHRTLSSHVLVAADVMRKWVRHGVMSYCSSRSSDYRKRLRRSYEGRWPLFN